MDRANSPGWATYLRVSDEDKQTPERSFAFQRQRIQEQLLSSSEIPFRREYCDMLTGTNPNRSDYQKMLADAAAGLFSHIGLYRADRFGRNTVEGLQAATKLIGLGIKIRVAHMPSLRPEEPDGFFMFLIQMGMAQREVDVLKQRTSDGMEAKLRAGGWPSKAPEGYVNRERSLKSNKYERWVEPDPVQFKTLRAAWDLLLTDRFTLTQICEELTRQGLIRSLDRPWAWTNARTGERLYAKNRLQEIFHNPFYAGWVVSEKYGIPFGEIKGVWEPVVTTQEWEKGIEILHKHDAEKSRNKRIFYMLRNILWVRVNGQSYKLFGSTPTGRTKSYSYYITHATIDDSKLHISCETINQQIPAWLQGITVNPSLLPGIQKIYREQVSKVASEDREDKQSELQRKIKQLREEETRLGRLFITGKITEASYEKLRNEWQEKVRHAEANLKDLERNMKRYVDDLDLALILLAKMPVLFDRLDEPKRALLLRVLAKQIIVNPDGEIIDHQLHSPFTYLRQLVDEHLLHNQDLCGSDQVRLGSQNLSLSPISEPLEDIEWFLASLRFEQRPKLDELSIL